MKQYAILVVFESPVLARFLLVRHRRRGWELPGGHIEPGEDPRAAARREWTEETALPLARLVPLGLHERPDGSRGHLFLGAATAGPAEALPTLGQDVDPTGEVVQAAWFDRLADAFPLAWPDDPYDALARLILATTAGAGVWKLPPGETPEHFCSRLAAHRDARPRNDPIHAIPDHEARHAPSE